MICLLTWRFAAVSETRGGTPDKLETEADWDTANDEPEPHAASGKPNVHKCCRFDFGTSPWFDGHWSPAALWWELQLLYVGVNDFVSVSVWCQWT